MTTPNFKVLVNALQLGQPSDPAASIRALAEQMLAQQEEIGQLRRELALLQNRYAALTVMAEPEAPPSKPRTDGPHSEPPSSTRPTPNQPSSSRPQGHIPQAHIPHAQIPQAHIPHARGDEEQDEHNSTIVIAKRQLEAVEERGNAPFPIAPAGRLHRRREDAEIPGAPWASQKAVPARPASARPPPLAAGYPPESDVTHTTDALLDFEGMAPGDPNDGPPPIPTFDDEDDLTAHGRGRQPPR